MRLTFSFFTFSFYSLIFQMSFIATKITGSKNFGLKIKQSPKFSHKGCFRKRPHWSVERRYKQTSRTFPCLVGLFESNANGITTHLMNEIPLLCEVFFQVRKKYWSGQYQHCHKQHSDCTNCLSDSRKLLICLKQHLKHTHCQLVHIRAAFLKTF